MATSRRSFLVRAGLTISALGVTGGLPSAIVSAKGPKQTTPTGSPGVDLSRASFESSIGKTFQVRYHINSWVDGYVDATLTAVNGLTVSPAQTALGGEAFAIILRTTRPLGLTQDTYQVQTPDFGTLRLLLVPSAPDALGNDVMEAVFNHSGRGRLRHPLG